MGLAELDYTFTGKLSPDCKSLEIDSAPALARLFRPLLDVPLEINIKKFYRKRTLAQNNWIWGVCIPTIRAWLKETTGSCPSAEAVYTFLRVKVIGHEAVVEKVGDTDIIVLQGKRFSAMTTIEFAAAVDVIVEYYLEIGLEIPLPKPKTNNYITDFIKDIDDN